VRISSPEDGSQLMEAEVAWPPAASASSPTRGESWPPMAGLASRPARYILRWEAGQLLSVLLTNDTQAAIPLIYPEASLKVEVGLLGSNLVSAPLIITPRVINLHLSVPKGQSSKKTAVKPAAVISTATKVALSVGGTALAALLVVLAVMVAVLRRVTARNSRQGKDDMSFLRDDSSHQSLIRFENFLEKNRLSPIRLGII
jgi:hypothetical protein